MQSKISNKIYKIFIEWQEKFSNQLLNERQIIKEDFLENMNNILNTGEIAKLFDDEASWDEMNIYVLLQNKKES